MGGKRVGGRVGEGGREEWVGRDGRVCVHVWV